MDSLSKIPINYNCIFVLQAKGNHSVHIIIKDLPKGF